MSEEPRPRVRTRAARPTHTEYRTTPTPKPPERAPAKALLDYRLCILTNGRPCLRETIESFRWKVRPQPAEVVVFDDGGTQEIHKKMTPWHAIPAKTVYSPEPLGFCRATAALWREAAKEGPEWIVWLEDDLQIKRRIDLEQIVTVMEAEPQLAQMALYRDPVSDEEVAAGGYLNLPGREYRQRETEGQPWFEHTGYWTTNVSVFRRDIPRWNPWPTSAECEGQFGFLLKAARPGTTFGVWGQGASWTRHIGVRSGYGY